jgi:hypothetical protein
VEGVQVTDRTLRTHLSIPKIDMTRTRGIFCRMSVLNCELQYVAELTGILRFLCTVGIAHDDAPAIVAALEVDS